MNKTKAAGKVYTRRRLAVAAIGLALVATTAAAGDIQVTVIDAGGKPLANTAVMATWEAAAPAEPQAEPAVIVQRDLKFVPHMLIVPRDTSVIFPNQDSTRHHVYSFSGAKIFDIKLYSGRPGRPIVFDRPGVVTLGCNIHDQMEAFVVVTAEPRWAITDSQGRAVLSDVPDTAVSLAMWHPWMPREASRVTRELSSGEDVVRISVDVRPPPMPAHSGMSSLQQRFNQLAK